MNKAHAIYLLGMEVDFSGLDNHGVYLQQSNASSTCGCGITGTSLNKTARRGDILKYDGQCGRNHTARCPCGDVYNREFVEVDDQ
ncbi:MAG: hypothetical protein R2791_07315 [Saprospiraceae bacterium]